MGDTALMLCGHAHTPSMCRGSELLRAAQKRGIPTEAMVKLPSQRVVLKAASCTTGVVNVSDATGTVVISGDYSFMSV